MIGAIIGDIVGSRFEWRDCKSKEFELFGRGCEPTDDSVMLLAVAKAIVECDGDYADLSERAIACMRELGRAYPHAGYGGSFARWLVARNPQPYNSYGNGAGMRVGPCGFAAATLEEAKALSAAVTRVTHDHPEGMKGAEAIATAVWLAKSGADKDAIREYIVGSYYPLDFTIDGIRKEYGFDVSCQGSVPVALEAFLESSDFEDAIRIAVSVGGDSDTIAAMTGAVAEAYYGVPAVIVDAVIGYLDARQQGILRGFEQRFPSKAVAAAGDEATVFELIDGSDRTRGPRP